MHAASHGTMEKCFVGPHPCHVTSGGQEQRCVPDQALGYISYACCKDLILDLSDEFVCEGLFLSQISLHNCLFMDVLHVFKCSVFEMFLLCMPGPLVFVFSREHVCTSSSLKLIIVRV